MPDQAESIQVAASAATLYALITDLPRMAEWSPECTRVTWRGGPGARESGLSSPGAGSSSAGSPSSASSGRGSSGAGSPYAVVGARFIGHNRVGAVRWFTQGVVTEAVPDRRFTFHIHFGPLTVSDWTYELTPAADGTCTVTESWTDRRPRALRGAMSAVFGQRAPRNEHGIHTTLKNLKAAAESIAA